MDLDFRRILYLSGVVVVIIFISFNSYSSTSREKIYNEMLREKKMDLIDKEQTIWIELHFTLTEDVGWRFYALVLCFDFSVFFVEFFRLRLLFSSFFENVPHRIFRYFVTYSHLDCVVISLSKMILLPFFFYFFLLKSDCFFFLHFFFRFRQVIVA